MKISIGTKSLLYGYHQVIIHPLVLAVAWTKLYGFPRDWRLWLAFFVHDLGYWGKPNMDGPEGETHPYFGARLMHAFFGLPPNDPKSKEWYDFMLYHSRFLAKKAGQQPSKLCYADKLAIIILPTWIQVFLMRLTGEINEYRRGQHGRTPGDGLTDSQWVEKMKATLRAWFAEEKKRKAITERREEMVSWLRAYMKAKPTASFSLDTFDFTSADEAVTFLKSNFGDSFQHTFESNTNTIQLDFK